jgi:hypothetical protein
MGSFRIEESVMAMWRDTPAKEPITPARENLKDADFNDRVIEKASLEKVSLTPAPAPTPDLARRANVGSVKESIIASDLIIEGKIEGAGHVRIAGKFKGDVNVQGNLTIEPGDLKAGSLTVAAGSRMRGRVEFGWNDRPNG